jgi:hypothetical protein
MKPSTTKPPQHGKVHILIIGMPGKGLGKLNPKRSSKKV